MKAFDASNPEHEDIAKRGTAAIEQWAGPNQNRGPDEPLDLKYADLSGADLRGCVFPGETAFRGTDLSKANLRDSDFSDLEIFGCSFRSAKASQVNFDTVTFREADFSDSRLNRSNFRGSEIRGCNFDGATMWSVNLTDVHIHGGSFKKSDFQNVDLSRTWFHGVDLSEVLFRGVIGFNLDGVNGFVMDGHQITSWRFPSTPSDPWSELRHEYTGFIAGIHLLLAGFAMAPFLLRALRSSLPFQGHTRISIMLGFDKNWFILLSSLFLITYNGFRVFMTYRLSRLRESETRSGFGPMKKEYWHIWKIHSSAMRKATKVSFGLALVRTLLWLFEVPLP